MIVSVVPADKPIGTVHRADWPDPPRCARGARYRIGETFPMGGVAYAVGRCLLPAGHDEPCIPGGSAAACGVPGWPPLATLCRIPIRPDEPWVILDPRDSDRLCRRCAATEREVAC